MNKIEYMLGAFGDAHLDFKRKEVQIYQKNLEWLEYLNGLLYDIIGSKGRIFKRDVYVLRKKSKLLFEIIKRTRPDDSLYFVAGFFDSEGSIYASSKSKIPVLDITQSEKGKVLLEKAMLTLNKIGVRCHLNGPYKHYNSKLPAYHLRIYGWENLEKFCKHVQVHHPEKLSRIMSFRVADPKL